MTIAFLPWPTSSCGLEGWFVSYVFLPILKASAFREALQMYSLEGCESSEL